MEKFYEKLKTSGNKLTKPRKAILDSLRQAGRPLSAREIHGRIKGVDLASVYRNLGLFKDLGIVQNEAGEKQEKYCLALKPHHHIVCSNCGYTESIACTHKFTHNNFTGIKHRLTLTGLCRKCS